MKLKQKVSSESTPTAEQLAAITSEAKNIVVIAGPGSGKSSVLLWRIEHMIESGFNPEGMVAITFTNNAAQELRSRLSKPIGFCGTIHSFLFGLLQNAAIGGDDAAGFVAGMKLTVLDEDSTESMINECANDLRYKGTKKALDEALAQPFEQSSKPAQLVAKLVYRGMQQHGMLSYDAILHFAKRFLEKRQTLWTFEHLFLDEAQDLTQLEYDILDLTPFKTRFLIGDPDQGIFAWRGAKPEHLIDFWNSPQWAPCRLSLSFRCPVEIAEAANRLIFHNQVRAPKTIAAINHGSLTVERFTNTHEEMEFLKDGLRGLGNIGILFRTNWLCEHYFKALTEGFTIMTEPERPPDWHQVMLFLSWLANPSNDYLWIKLMLGYDSEEAAEIATKALQAKQSVNTYQTHLPTDWNAWQAVTRVPVLHPVLTGQQVSNEMVSAMTNAASGLPRDATINDLILAMREKPKIKSAGVRIMTYHAAKGLEFDHVFLPALEDHFFPGKDDAEESRRLLFVGLTRAKHSVTITWSERRLREWSERGKNHVLPSEPSRFIREMGL